MATHITIPMARLDELEDAERERDILRKDLQYARDGLKKGRSRMREDNGRLRAALEKIEAGNCIDPRTVARDALGPNARLTGPKRPEQE